MQQKRRFTMKVNKLAEIIIMLQKRFKNCIRKKQEQVVFFRKIMRDVQKVMRDHFEKQDKVY